MTDRPMMPTSAKWKARARMSQTPTRGLDHELGLALEAALGFHLYGGFEQVGADVAGHLCAVAEDVEFFHDDAGQQARRPGRAWTRGPP